MTALAPFHPAIQSWFASRLGEPTAPQRDGWPLIREGRHTLIAAPTGSGKTLAAFLSAIDALLRQGPELPDETQVLYVSPLQGAGERRPEEPARARSPRSARWTRRCPRSACSCARATRRRRSAPRWPDGRRTSWSRRPSRSTSCSRATAAARMLRTRAHGDRRRDPRARARQARLPPRALARAARGALRPRGPARSGSRRRRSRSTRSAASSSARGASARSSTPGTFRELDLAIEIPPSPLSTVCSHEQWEEIYARMADADPRAPHDARLREHAQDGRAHRRAAHEGPRARTRSRATTGASRASAGSTPSSGSRRDRCGRSSRRPRSSSGIDIGDVDLVIQVGATRSIATFLQRVGRAGHALSRVPKGRFFPLTLDELVEAAALLRCVRAGRPRPHARSRRAPLDILAQQVVAACVAETVGRGGALRRRSAAPGPTATSRARSSTRSSRSTRRGGGRCSTATA